MFHGGPICCPLSLAPVDPPDHVVTLVEREGQSPAYDVEVLLCTKSEDQLLQKVGGLLYFPARQERWQASCTDTGKPTLGIDSFK